MSLFARLVEEVGEVSREYNHSFGAKKKKPGCEGGGISDELGDLLFILICMANQQGIDLDDALAQSLKKYDIRDATRWA